MPILVNPQSVPILSDAGIWPSDGLCPLFLDNLAECYYNAIEPTSIRRAIYLCHSHNDQCRIYIHRRRIPTGPDANLAGRTAPVKIEAESDG